MSTLSLIQWAMAYRQLRGRAASLSPKSRPKVHLPARSVLCLPEILSQPLAQCAKREGLLMMDASHIMAKPAPQSVAQYLPPFSHTGQFATAGRLVSLFCAQFTRFRGELEADGLGRKTIRNRVRTMF